MSAVVIARADDEIADLIDRIRSSGDPDVGLVVPGSSQALKTPLNVRLLAQFSNQSGRRTAIVSEDPRVQELARASGLQVYGSVPAYERGIELAAPRGSTFGPVRGGGLGAAAGGSAAAVLEAPPPPPPRRRHCIHRSRRRRHRASNRDGSSRRCPPRARSGAGIGVGGCPSAARPSRSSGSSCS